MKKGFYVYWKWRRY